MPNAILRAGQFIFSQPYLLLTFTMLFWAGNAVAGKVAVGEISPMALTSMRWFCASLILCTFARGHLKRDAATVRRSWPGLALLGAVGLGAFSIFLYVALHYTSAVNVSIEQAAMPIFIIVINLLVHRAPVGPMPLLGIVVTLVGVAIVASHGNLGALLELSINIGDAYMILACLLYSAYSVGIRHRPDIHWLSFLAMLTGFAALATLPALLWELQSGAFVFTPKAFGVLLYVVLFPSILAQLFFARGVELIGANRAGVFANFVPVFGAVLAVLILGEAFHLYHLAALALVLCGVMLAERYRDRPWRWAGRMRG